MSFKLSSSLWEKHQMKETHLKKPTQSLVLVKLLNQILDHYLLMLRPTRGKRYSSICPPCSSKDPNKAPFKPWAS